MRRVTATFPLATGDTLEITGPEGAVRALAGVVEALNQPAGTEIAVTVNTSRTERAADVDTADGREA